MRGAGHFCLPDLAVEARVEFVQEVHHVTDLARVVVRGEIVHAAAGARPEKLLP